MNHRLSTAIRIGDAASAILRTTQRMPDDAIGEDEHDWNERDHFGVKPMLLALSMELALKAWFVFDYNVPKAKWGHDLAKLFDALTPESQQKLDEAFRRAIAPRLPGFFYADFGVRDILDHHKDAFTDWRYLHEDKKALHFDTSTFEATLEMVLDEFRNRYRIEQVTPHLQPAHKS